MSGLEAGGEPIPEVAAARASEPRIREPRTLRLTAWLKQFAKLWGFALFCLFVIYVFREVALPFVFAILVAYILAPLVDRMARLRVAGRPFPRGLAVVLLYVNILALLGLFVGYFIPKLSGDFARLFREAPQLFERLDREWVPRAGSWVDQHLGAGSHPSVPPTPPRDASSGQGIVLEPLPGGRYRLDLTGLTLEVTPGKGGRLLVAPPLAEETFAPNEGRWERSIKRWITERVRTSELESQKAIEYGQRFVTAVITGVARLILVLMVAAFILIDLQRIRGFTRSLVPGPYQGDYDRIVGGIDRGLSGVIRGQLVICLINGLFTYVGLWIFDVKYSLLLAGIASLMSLVPIFGSILSSIPIVTIAIVSSGGVDLRRGLIILCWIVLIHLVEANFLNPKILGGSAKIHPVLVVFALIAGEHTYGIVGALFAVPVASIIQTIFVYYWRRGFARPDVPMTPR